MMRRPLALLLAAALGLGAPAALAYPLDGYPWTRIKRLEAYRLAAQGSRIPSFLTEGEMLPGDAVRLNLVSQPEFQVPAPDADLSARVTAMLGRDKRYYGIAVLDYSEPARPRYAAVNPDRPQNPGSVGKIMVLLAWFQALADIYPDVADRQRLLLETEITADAFIRKDSHDVPFWDFGASAVDRRPIAEGDRANLWTFMDWTASASSNAAASTLMQHLMLLVHFRERYPVPKSEADAWFKQTPRKQLSKLYLDAMRTPATRSGIDLSKLRQGHFFTREGKNRVPGVGSTSTAGELLNFIVKMEQGKLVDAWSSREIKKLLYLTDTAIRYAVIVLSNVLRKDSSELHQSLGAQIHAIMEESHPEPRVMPAMPAGGASDATAPAP